ncbi:hypothetical protein ACG2K1_02160 [Neisseria sp. 23W00296]|uniref:hypothetical protein n=1 Tax=unclassified Neisseria TaxID=2623750 RepID=UPI003756E903
MNLNFFHKLYQKSEAVVLSLLSKRQWSEKQADALATKLDIFGAFLVTQAWLGFTKYGWHFLPALVLFLASLAACCFFWMIAFILKGYKK